jgi:hypothetical protein
MAQTVDRTDRRRTAHREQGDGSGLSHAKTQPKHEGRHCKDAATGTGQAEYQAHDQAKKTCQQHKTLMIREKKPGTPGID